MESLFENNGSLFSTERSHRYALWRIWDESLPKIMFIGLNPSTASENEDDPTIRRVIRFARKWGFGGVYMLNLFTFITAYPKELKECKNPLLLADWYLTVFQQKSNKVVFAWGNFPEAEERAKKVKTMFLSPMCLGKNSNGSPKHPLYLPGSTELIYFS